MSDDTEGIPQLRSLLAVGRSLATHIRRMNARIEHLCTDRQSANMQVRLSIKKETESPFQYTFHGF